MMSKHFNKEREYHPTPNPISYGIYDEKGRILVILLLKREGKREDIGIVFENREEVVEFFESGLRALER